MGWFVPSYDIAALDREPRLLLTEITNTNTYTHSSRRFVIVERSVDSLRQQITSLSADMSRVTGEVSAMGRSVNAQESMVESLRRDMNSRRGMLAKMESWVADEEVRVKRDKEGGREAGRLA